MYALRWFTNQTIYTTVKQCSFTCTHNDGLQPHHLHRTADTNCKPFLAWTMIIYTAVKQQTVLHVCTMMVYNHIIYTAVKQCNFTGPHSDNLQPLFTLSNCTALQAVQLYRPTQWQFTTTFYTIKLYSFTSWHSDDIQPHHLHCCQPTTLHACTVMIYNHTIYTAVSLQLYMPAQQWKHASTTTPFTLL